MRKGSSGWQNILLLKWRRRFGIRVSWNIIFGTPSESDDWYAEQAQLLPKIHHLEPGLPTQLQFCRFSPYHANAPAWGLRLEPAAHWRLIYPLPVTALSQLVYFFENMAVKLPLEPSSGVTTYMVGLARWRREWQNTNPPVCCLVKRNDKHFVVDTRTCAVSAVWQLEPLAAKILHLSSEGTTASQLVRNLFTEGWCEELETRAAVENLLERNLLLEIDGKLLSLVLDQPPPALPMAHEFPGGHVSENN